MADILAEDRSRIALVLHLVSRHGKHRGLRILDLACRTGAFSYALAGQGHSVTGVEGRQGNLDQAPSHPKIEYELLDVRKVSRKSHGTFDIALCLGLLYHLTAEDSLSLLRTLGEMVDSFVVVDTHISKDAETTTIEGHIFSGHAYAEPETDWSSIGNESSWWFTEDSLCELVELAGWSVMPVDSPEGVSPDRCWFLLHHWEIK